MEITSKFEETAREIEERVLPQIENAKERLSVLNDSAISYIKENPGKCLIGAIAAGYLIGRLATR